MKKLVTVRQLVFILMVSQFALKVLYLPSLLTKDIGRDMYLYVFLMMIADFFVLLMFLNIIKRNPNLSFYEILEKCFGKFIAKFFILLFLLFFLFKCWVSFQTNYAYLNENLYTILSPYVFAIPILIVLFYMTKFGVNAFARLTEICAPIIVVGFVLSLVVGCSRADYTNLLPICENGFFYEAKSIFDYFFWFGDFLIIIVFFGNVKLDKKISLKVSIPIMIFILIITFFIATTYAVYSYNMVCHSNAISDMLQVIPSASDLGSFDWILILIWDMELFLYFSLNTLGSFYCFRQLFSKSGQVIPILLILAIVLISNYLLDFDIFNNILIARSYLKYFSVVVQYVLPVIIFAFSFKLKRREDEVSMEK